MRTLIIIPAYNEEITIGSVVALARKYGDVLVVDDGSEDRTSQIAQSTGATIIRHETNRGKGEALKSGFKFAIDNNYDVIVCLDGDGQHNPDEIPILLEPIIKEEADFVIGSRYLSKDHKTPFYRRLGLFILNKMTNLTSDVNVTDSQSGFRAFSRRVLELLNLSSVGYGVESEMISQVSGKVRIIEVPVNIRYDVPKKHKRNFFLHGTEVLAKIVGIIGYKRPLLLFSTLSFICMAVSGFLAYWALQPYYMGGNVFLTQAIGAGIFAIIGIQLFVAGLMLNVLAKMVER